MGEGKPSERPRPVIIFDCDGVLFDSNELKTKAFSQVLRNSGFPENVIDEFISHHKSNGGISRYVKFERLYTDILRKPLPENGIADLLGGFAIACVSLYGQADFTPSCVDVLISISSEYSLYVASGSDQEELREVFNKREIDGLFKSILGSPMPKSGCVKAIISKVRAGVNCIMVGDSVSDWNAANENGIDFIFMSQFSEDNCSMLKLANQHGFPVIQNLKQLEGLL